MTALRGAGPLRTRNSHRILRMGLAAIMSATLGYLTLEGWEATYAAKAAPNIRTEEADGNLEEIKDKHHVALLLIRSSVLDASGTDGPIVAEALASRPQEALRHRYPYRLITRELNKYMRKYRSMQPVYDLGQADFIIYFRLVEYRRQLNGYYPFGELFVIVNQLPGEDRPARVIWKTKKVMFAEDAVKDLIKEFKRARGER